jgi:hypothetical protein
MQSNESDTSSQAALQSHAYWFRGKTALTKQYAGVIKFQNNVFTFVDDSSKELVKVSTNELKRASRGAVGRMSVLKLRPLEKAKLLYSLRRIEIKKKTGHKMNQISKSGNQPFSMPVYQTMIRGIVFLTHRHTDSHSSSNCRCGRCKSQQVKTALPKLNSALYVY